MALSVNGFSDLQDWAESKSCAQWKAERSCQHEPCVQAQRAADILAAAVQGPTGVWTIEDATVTFTA